VRRFHFCLLLAFIILRIPTWPPAYAQSPGVDLCIYDFEDRNQNGQPDDGEASFPGVGVFVRRTDTGELIGSLTTSPDEDCLRSLQPADYEVTFRDGMAHQPTTATVVQVALTAQTATVNFGAIALPTGQIQALQAPGNQICVLVYNDTNANGQRDSNESLLAGVDVNLAVEDTIIETLMTDDQDYRCFVDLPAGAYHIVIPESARHQMTTRNDSAPTFINIGNRVDIDFGAVLLNPFSAEAVLPNYGISEDKFTLDRDTRVLLAIFGMTLAMLFMIGCGAIILGLLRR
jgi:hypothetical protein